MFRYMELLLKLNKSGQLTSPLFYNLVSVEDPSEDFVRCRDYVDCLNCMKLDEFNKVHLCKGYSNSMKTAALNKFKINKVCF